MKTDYLIIGAGPAGIFTALELIKRGCKDKITFVEKGAAIEKRACPKAKTGVCMNCKNCAITTGFSGAGAFSDGKLSLSADVGGDLPDLIGFETVQSLIEYTDKIYLDFGADKKIEGVGHAEEIKEIRKKAIQAGLKLVDCPIRHMGTEKAQKIYYDIEQFLLNNGVEMHFNSECVDLTIENEVCTGADVVINGKTEHVDAKEVIVATGRRGALWLEVMCAKHGILHQPGTVDIGVRVEVRNEVMEEINKVLYEAKLIGYPKPF
ncbi:MAG TPA: FAD-dependent oxidoreductase, partial [Clostridiales bacterium]|nr:FAD-dependent oxidoreductase [Clostridiales bacterium]